MAALGGPEHRSRISITALCVDIGAGLEEKVAESVVAVDGSPLEDDKLVSCYLLPVY
jgi:hypothetical protein